MLFSILVFFLKLKMFLFFFLSFQIFWILSQINFFGIYFFLKLTRISLLKYLNSFTVRFRMPTILASYKGAFYRFRMPTILASYKGAFYTCITLACYNVLGITLPSFLKQSRHI